VAHDWKDPAIAEAWDARHLTGNPSRGEHLALLFSMLDQVNDGWVADLGCGSGLVAQMVLDHSPTARVFGLDSSAAMLRLATHRLARYGERVRLAEGDLTALDRIEVPAPWAAVIAVQSLHHLTPPEYAAVVRWTFEHLEAGGWFFIIDRLAIPSQSLYPVFHDVKERQGQSPNPTDWPSFLQQLDANGDRPLSAQAVLRVLEEAGFEAAVLDVRGDRGILVGRRQPPPRPSPASVGGSES
jgi:trans-aconitate methyltransferase